MTTSQKWSLLSILPKELEAPLSLNALEHGHKHTVLLPWLHTIASKNNVLSHTLGILYVFSNLII